MNQPDQPRDSRGERGTGVFSMAFGVLIFFVLLTMMLQVMFNLYTTSVVTGLALDAAHDVAEFDGQTIAAAEAQFKDQVGSDVDFTINVVGSTVVASLRWETKSLFPSISNARAFGVLERDFTVRLEEQQP